MKAAVFEQFGPPNVLKIKNIDKPQPKPNEILIKIKATTVNSGDIKMRSKNVPWFFKMPMSFFIGFRSPKNPVLGNALSGIVEQKGQNVTMFEKGDEVYGSTGMTFGTYTEYISVPETAPVCKKPSSLTFEEAASIPFGAQSALHFLKAAKIHQGDKVLVYGASGAVGSAVVQIAKSYGAEVTGVTSKVELMKQLGVNSINYKTENYLTKGSYDIIYETTGLTNFADNLNIPNQNGRLILLTVNSLNWYFRTLWKNMTGNKRVIVGVAEETKQNLLQITQLINTKKFKPVIDRVYNLDQISEAHAYVEQGHKTGAVVVTI